MKLAKTRDVLAAYRKGKMQAVAEYLFQEELEFKEGTWVNKAKKLLEEGSRLSLEEEINMILYKGNL